MAKLRPYQAHFFSAESPNNEEIDREADRLESQLEQLYSFTALMAGCETDIGRTTDLWQRPVRIVTGSLLAFSSFRSSML